MEPPHYVNAESDEEVEDDSEEPVDEDDEVVEIFEGVRPITTKTHPYVKPGPRKPKENVGLNKMKLAFPSMHNLPNPHEMLLRPMQNVHHRSEAHAPNAKGLTVRYLDPDRRKRYEVTMGATIRFAINGMVFDSTAVRQGIIDKKTIAKEWSLSRANWGKPLGKTLAEMSENGEFKVKREWKKALIWVIAPDKAAKQARFYSHVCKGGRFHHSSFNSGKSVIGAGEWVVEAGKMLLISGNSGHYRPDLAILTQSVLLMTEAWNDETQVTMYDTRSHEWVNRPVREFADNPSGGGQFKVHPQS